MPKLTVLRVKNAPTGRHADGLGLYLLVKPSGSRSWVLRAQSHGRRRDFGLGSAELVSLHEAREKAREGLKMLRLGYDPSVEWKRGREVTPTFEEAATQYHESVQHGWRNGKHVAQWLSTLRAYAFPTLGARRVDQIDAAAVQSALLPIWLDKPETARRVRQRIAAVLDYAHSRGWRATEAPARAIAKGLPKQPRQGRHFAAMPYADVPALVTRLQAEEASVGRLALLFCILTAARSGEVRGATWGEIDGRTATWTIPAERMKGGEAHTVPLSEPARTALEQAKRLGRCEPDAPIFAGLRGNPLSDMTLAKALRGVGGAGATVHGFRSSFRDWVAEQTSFAPEWAEAALAHSLVNRVEAAYRRTKFVEQRRQLMDAWANYVTGAGTVIQLITSHR